MSQSPEIQLVHSVNPPRLFSALIVLTALGLMSYMGASQVGLPQGLLFFCVGAAIVLAPISAILGAFALVARKNRFAEFFSQYYLLYRELTKFILPNDLGLTGIAITNLAVLAVSEGRFLDAKELLTERCTLKIDQALKVSLLGQICAFTGERDEAFKKLAEAKDLVCDASGETPDQAHMEALAEFYSNECGLLPDIGKADLAIESGLKGLQLREKFCGSDSYEVAKTLNNIGYAYLKAEKFPEATEALERAFRIAQKLNKESDYAGGNITNNLGCALMAVGEKDRAFELLSVAIKLPADGPFENGFRQYSLGRYYSEMGQFKEAAIQYSRAFHEWRNMQGLQHPDYTQCVSQYAEALEKLGKTEERKKVVEGLRKLQAGEHVPPKAMPQVR